MFGWAEQDEMELFILSTVDHILSQSTNPISSYYNSKKYKPRRGTCQPKTPEIITAVNKKEGGSPGYSGGAVMFGTSKENCFERLRIYHGERFSFDGPL